MEGKHFQSIQKGMEEKGFLVEITSLSFLFLRVTNGFLEGINIQFLWQSTILKKMNVTKLSNPYYTFHLHLIVICNFRKKKHLSKTKNKYKFIMQYIFKNVIHDLKALLSNFQISYIVWCKKPRSLCWYF